jgi:hypothetical protein
MGCSIALSSTPSTNPAMAVAPLRLVADLTGPVRGDSWLPLKLTFTSDDEAPRHYRSVDFLFEILDENGRQVMAPSGASIFVYDQVIRDVDLSKKAVVYTPKLMFNPRLNALVAGRKYQLIVVIPKADLIGAMQFTFE